MLVPHLQILVPQIARLRLFGLRDRSLKSQIASDFPLHP